MTDEQITRAARLWGQGISTFSIAMIMKIDESAVYNRIEQIKRESVVPIAKMTNQD